MGRVAYSPLAKGEDGVQDANGSEEHAEEEEGEEEEDGDEDELFNRADKLNHLRLSNSLSQTHLHHNQNLKRHHVSSLMGFGGRFSLFQLRILLYVLAFLLCLLFIAQLTTTNNTHQHRNKVPSSLKVKNPIDQTSTSSSSSSSSGDNKKPSDKPSLPTVRPSKASTSPELNSYPSSLSPSSPSDSSLIVDERPQYDSYLSSVLHLRNYRGQFNQGPLDDLHYPSATYERDQTRAANIASQSSLNLNTTVWWLLNMRDKYVTVTNYIRAMKSFSYNSSITLTTQATTEFMYHTLELCERWDGPISVAIFSPGTDLIVAVTLIKFIRQCLPAPLSACVMDKVTWHLVYNKSHGPSPSTIGYPRYHLDSENYPLFVNQDQCPKLAGPSPIDMIKQFELELRRNLVAATSVTDGGNPVQVNEFSYRKRNQLPYPINVLRNTARLASSTKYVLASDIELYPSINLVSSFTNFIRNHNVKDEYKYIKKFVFTLPIFEVKANITPPKTKQELVSLFQKGDAIFFHKWVCDVCQNFPHRLEWLKTEKYGYGDNYQATSNNNELVIFTVTQRDNTRNSWEPIFIGTNDDPLYDDRLTWEGRRDKMGQMYELCLQEYYLLVLGNAFLVHAPGIKHIDKNDNMKRLNYIRENNAIYDATIIKLREQYADSPDINKC